MSWSRQDLRAQLQGLLARAGVTLDGERPFDPQIRDDRFHARVLAQGSLGLGEAYVDGWWECEAIDELVCRLRRALLDREVRARPSLWSVVKAKLLNLNLQSATRAFANGQHHYDRGNDLYEAMLDRRMIYTGAIWDGARDLDQAQEQKLERVARKLHLEPGQRVLDIGCGWGGTAKFLAERHGVSVVGITVSREQERHARELCRGLPVRIELKDYRDLDEKFDRVVSLGMLEHVGHRNYPAYFDVVRRCLNPDGIFVLQSIGSTNAGQAFDPWIERYIFPNAQLPTSSALSAAAEDRMVFESWENFGADYGRTLMAWSRNFEAAWPQLRQRYDERFHRMWRFYLLACAGSFRARSIQLWQIVYSPQGVMGGYRMDSGQSGERLQPARRLEAAAGTPSR
jgi:cyclopropane-fatty-acyl-phospholipid synthase